MARIVHKCPKCGKPAETKSEKVVFGTMGLRTYSCGHSVTYNTLEKTQSDTLDIESLDGKHLFPYQLDGARFLEQSNGRALIADEMGLGKTVQAIAFLVAHPELHKFVIFVKSGLRLQWHKECVRWGDSTDWLVQVIDDTRPFFLKQADGYIISIDSAWRIGLVEKELSTGKKIKVPEEGNTLLDQLKKVGVKTMIIDECQLIKSVDSKRTKAIQDIAGGMNHVIALSGTPIKNHAGEYFPVLNMIRPDKFPSQHNFTYSWCNVYRDGYTEKIGGIKDPKRFQEFTSDFIIRRERKDVLPDLPSIFRQFHFTELGETVEDAYKREVQNFQKYYNQADKNSGNYTSSILAYFTRMRHLTGVAKIEPVFDFIEDFLDSYPEDRKLALFVHHDDVHTMLHEKLKKKLNGNVVSYTAALSTEKRESVIQQFKNSARVAVLSTLASSEGLNLQFCADCVMMERQWNPANEEQAEARFPRPGQLADKINAYYFVAVGTIDEFFAEIVEKKREIVNRTLSGEAQPWNESSLIKELAEALAVSGLRKWSY